MSSFTPYKGECLDFEYWGKQDLLDEHIPKYIWEFWSKTKYVCLS